MRKDDEIDRFAFERAALERGTVRIAGVDEVGRGPLAGPVTAAAVVLPRDLILSGMPSGLARLNDSKQLSAAQREEFYQVLTNHPGICWGLSSVEVGVIDAINILRATHQAMAQALAALKPPPDHILVDGLEVRSLAFPQTALVKGDARSYSIAAASVLAKVTRDRLMIEYDRRYPHYGFAQHKGYGTPEHRAALKQYGPCPIHRRSFTLIRPAQTTLF